MPRDIPLSNGTLLVCFDQDYRIRDLYFPHVGQENHLSGAPLRFGVFSAGVFSWVGPDWKRELAYEEDTLVGRTSLYHEGLSLLLVCRDCVDFHENIYLREVTVENLLSTPRSVELFFTHDFDISGNSIGDTAAYDPQCNGLVHYKGRRAFLASGMTDQGEGLSQYAVGVKRAGAWEGTFRDAEDGRLSGNAIAQGSVDSVLSLRLNLPPRGGDKAYYWLCAAETWAEARRLDGIVRRKSPRALLKRTAGYWRLWARKESPPLETLPDKVGRLYRRSLLVLNTQIDAQGGILAANDSDVIQYNRDTYSYVWPRDGALVANALGLAGYRIPAERFFHFMARVIEKDGYLLHKYTPDGSLASSWHPWSESGKPVLPIQEDGTALVVWALWEHFALHRDIEFVKPLYRGLIKRAGDFMVAYRDPETGLPGPSYDLWEERRGVFAFTAGAVFGGLTAAALFCSAFDEPERAAGYKKAASEIRDGVSKHLWREDLGRFCRMAREDGDGALVCDPTLDASLWGLYAFGMYAVRDPRIEATMAAARKALWVEARCGGMARFENDGYYRRDDSVPGNPWFISTLWLADYLLAKAETKEDLRAAADILVWTADHALASGVLAEQLDPHACTPLSVSPLTWSHATFVAVVQHYMRKVAAEEFGYAHGRARDWIGSLYAETCDAIRGFCRIR